MALALDWAAEAINLTSPNPRVGCVIVRDGQLLGAGHTLAAGQAHAEVQAMQDARVRGFDPRGATVYVTLEPCSHHGRTPPCADALIAAGVARVVCAVQDPNPLVAGRGLARLRAAGIAVTCGVMEADAIEMNIGFFHRMRTGRPWVRMKTAASLDGKTALFNGQSQWITGPSARDDGHLWRARACAILTGIGTVQSDDPALTVRAIETPRQPRRIVVDSRLQIEPSARILQSAPAWIATAQSAAPNEEALLAQGHVLLKLPDQNGKVDLPGLMHELGRREINELHVEAGAKLNGSLLREGCVNELLVYLAPSLLGNAREMFDLPTLTTLSDQTRLHFHEIKQIGPDLRILARLN
ncbi:MAG: bifunctional diaminohydroxyphosphoribosylaminopyrimidine deaminase/5-amino-6-(5-phosphoribosylamino)uracil reductase RibD, partial [Pseudomonadota bacterium]|nr:bifunctional diaminohydroxyphosphoribosylaminopyrimidine deaminase/5-amino-6-(5-phosphoribosylamino)uracil reductase RibD [Pseudomonadota bacterium]